MATLAWLTREPSLRFATRADLWEELGAFRPVEGRLVGAAYAAVGTVPSRNELRPVTRQLEIRKAQTASPQASADLAVLRLPDDAVPTRFESRYGPAVELLEAATTEDPTNGRLWSDLAAVRLAQGKGEHDLKALILALAAAEKAVKAEPELREALFNRALALDALHLRHVAKEAWQRYLEHDSKSEWAKEAREALARLNLPTARDKWLDLKAQLDGLEREEDIAPWAGRAVREFPQQAREMAEEELLGEWGRAWEAGEIARAEKVLAAAREIGERLMERNQDYLVADAVGAIDEARRAGDGRRLGLLARAHVGLREGVAALRERQTDRARKQLSGAAGLLRAAGSPLLVRAEIELGSAAHQEATYRELVARLRRTSRPSEGERYPFVLARTLWLRASARAAEGRLTDALVDYYDALTRYERGAETDNVLLLRSYLADVRSWFGDLSGGAAELAAGLPMLPDHLSAMAGLSFRDQLAESASALHEFPAAVRFYDEGLLGSNPVAAWARYPLLRDRARALANAGHMDEARQDLERAELDLGSLLPRVQAANRAELSTALSEVLEQLSPGAALQAATEAIELYQAIDSRHKMLPRARARRAATLVRLDRRREAEVELEAALAQLRAQSPLMDSDQIRSAEFQAYRAVYEQLVELKVRNGDAAGALAFAASGETELLEQAAAAHRGRRRTFGLPHLEVRRAQEQLPPGSTLLAYSAHQGQMYLFVLSPNSLQVREARVSSAELEETVGRWLSALAGSSSADEDDLRFTNDQLWRWFVEPVVDLLQRNSRVLILPDEAMDEVPLAALRSPVNGRFVVEDFQVEVVLSLSFLESSSRQETAASRLFRRSLVVDASSFDPSLFPNLRQLPGAAAEASWVARTLKSSHLLRGRDATPAKLLEAARQATLLHFAGHAVQNQLSLFESGLVLSPEVDSGETGLLSLRELQGLDAPQLQLVFLSACSTGRRSAASSAVQAILAGSFLVAGIPEVVATAWDVSDRQAPALTRLFYEKHLQGSSSAAALRAAQLTLLASGDPELRHVRSWGSYQAFTGFGAGRDHSQGG